MRLRNRYVSKPGVVAKIRQRRFWTQETLANTAGVSLDVVYRMEKPVASAVSIDSITKVAKALEVSPDEIAEPDENTAVTA